MPNPDADKSITVEPVRVYSPEVAAGIGRLMPYLDPNFSGDPTPREYLEDTIASPHHDQLVALRQGQVVGAAVLTKVRGSGVHKNTGEINHRAQLEDFVVDPEIRREGVGDAVWQGMIDWCRDNGLGVLAFETEAFRPDAIAFYQKHGAEIVPDTYHLALKIPPSNESGEDGI